MIGQVYFISGEAGGPVKIGFTASSALERVKALQTGSAERLVALGAYPGGEDLERAFHALCGPHRLTGEWFKREGIVLELIDRMPIRFDPKPRKETHEVRREPNRRQAGGDRPQRNQQPDRPEVSSPGLAGEAEKVGSGDTRKEAPRTWRRGRRIAGEAHLVIEQQKPWLALGMSRATWYKRKAKGEL